MARRERTPEYYEKKAARLAQEALELEAQMAREAAEDALRQDETYQLLMALHRNISASHNMEGRQRRGGHEEVGKLAFALLGDNPAYGWGFGPEKACLYKYGRIEEAVGVFGFFPKTHITSTTVLLRLWQSQIPDSSTEYVENVDGVYFYNRNSLGATYELFGRILAHQGEWIVVEPSAPFGNRSDYNSVDAQYVVGASDNSFDGDDYGFPEFGEIKRTDFPPQHYNRSYWHSDFGTVDFEKEDEDYVEFYGETEDRFKSGTLERRIEEAQAKGYTILAVLVEPQYVWGGRVYIATTPTDLKAHI